MTPTILDSDSLDIDVTGDATISCTRMCNVAEECLNQAAQQSRSRIPHIPFSTGTSSDSSAHASLVRGYMRWVFRRAREEWAGRDPGQDGGRFATYDVMLSKMETANHFHLIVPMGFGVGS